MPLVSGASMMSLGTWGSRSSKYQRFLNISNVFLLITSTILNYIAGPLLMYFLGYGIQKDPAEWWQLDAPEYGIDTHKD